MTEHIPSIIADGHLILRSGPPSRLGGQPGFEMVGEAATGVEAVNLRTGYTLRAS